MLVFMDYFLGIGGINLTMDIIDTSLTTTYEPVWYYRDITLPNAPESGTNDIYTDFPGYI